MAEPIIGLRIQLNGIDTVVNDVKVLEQELRKAKEDLIDIGITGNKIACIEPKIRSTGKSEINADGGMVTESFVNPHLHLCKVWTLGLMDGTTLDAYQGSGMSNAASAIEMAADVKNLYGFEDIVIRARRATTLAAIHGNLHIRAFADVDSISKLDAVRALLKVKEEFKGIVTLQVVAFPQDGIIKNAGTAALMEEAMALGADVVGGIPWIEFSDSDSQKHINICFDLAKKYNKDSNTTAKPGEVSLWNKYTNINSAKHDFFKQFTVICLSSYLFNTKSEPLININDMHNSIIGRALNISICFTIFHFIVQPMVNYLPDF